LDDNFEDWEDQELEDHELAALTLHPNDPLNETFEAFEEAVRGGADAGRVKPKVRKTTPVFR